jgi:[ribosomal protein S5]-alanine N-acetyltransferase
MSFVWADGVDMFEGDLVRVREVVDADAPTLFEMLSDPQVTEHMSAPPRSVDAFRGFIEWARRQRASGEGICFGIVPHGLDSAVGIVQLRAHEPSWFTADWGFAIGAAFWGVGAFIDAAHLVARFAFESLGVHRLEARAVMTNGRGNGALQKIGARPEGTLASAFRRSDRFDEQYLWGLNADDWRQRVLVRRRFTPADASAQIAAAIENVEKRLRAQKIEAATGEGPVLYRFFVTNGIADGPKDH